MRCIEKKKQNVLLFVEDDGCFLSSCHGIIYLSSGSRLLLGSRCLYSTGQNPSATEDVKFDRTKLEGDIYDEYVAEKYIHYN